MFNKFPQYWSLQRTKQKQITKDKSIHIDAYQKPAGYIILSQIPNMVDVHVSVAVSVCQISSKRGQSIVEAWLDVCSVNHEVHGRIENWCLDNLSKTIFQNHCKLTSTNKNQGDPSTQPKSIEVTQGLPSFRKKYIPIDPFYQNIKLVIFLISQSCKTGDLVPKVDTKQIWEHHSAL